jgi:single-strand selective monofunctional uracil DNA glycosylase
MNAHDAWIGSTRRLAQELAGLTFSPPVTHTYPTLTYAWEPHQQYLDRYGSSPKRVLFLGMNPGPFGMAQTGVPFGEITAVRDWMKIVAPVAKPDNEHPKRPIDGFACPRSEVSGRRLWGLFSSRYPKALDFFADHFVLNYCPLVWMSATGANLTPDKLPAHEMAPVESACLRHLAATIRYLQPQFLVGVGGYAEDRLRQAASIVETAATTTRILHPSPASPAANRGWAEAATRQLVAAGVWQG